MVEDHPLNRMLIEQYLKTLQANYTVVTDGEAVIELFKKGKEVFDAILMDIQLPGLNGHEVTQILRKELKVNIPIIALTANAFEEEREKSISSGMDDYLKKPFFVEDLYNVLKQNLYLEESKINLAYLKNYTNNNKEFTMQILEAFVAQTPNLLLDLKKAHEENNVKKIKAIAHKLIPLAVYVGLADLENTLKKIDGKKVDENNSKSLNLLINTVMQIGTTAIQQIKEEIKRLK